MEARLQPTVNHLDLGPVRTLHPSKELASAKRADGHNEGGPTNLLAQAQEFARAIPLTGLVLTKLDGTAKGGIAVAIVSAMKIPIRFVGLGEGLEDLVPFDARSFAESLLD